MPNGAREQIDSQFAAAKTAWQSDDVARAEALLGAALAAAPMRRDAAMLFEKVLRSRGRLRGRGNPACGVLRERIRTGEPRCFRRRD